MGLVALSYYYAVLSYRDAAGKRHQKWVSTGLPQKGNKRRAEQELIRIRSEFEIPPAAGELNSNMLFADYLDQWLEIVRARIKPATFGSYQGMVKSTIGPYFRKKELTLKELEARHIQQFYTEKLKTVTPNSVIHYHAVIYQALKYAMKTDMVPQNVAMKVDRPRKNSFQPTFLDAEQMQKLFEVVKGTRLELPVLVAAFYGLRRGEVLGLKWDAIDFNRGTLTIKRTVTEATIDGAMKIIEQDSAKTKSSLRTLPLVGSFRDYFQKVKEAQELNKKVCGNCYNYEYDGYVFVNELGERMRPNYLTEYFPKYIAKHGMPKMRFHDLRHTFAGILINQDVPLLNVSTFLGHSDLSTTANIYAHLDKSKKQESADVISSIFNKAKEKCAPPGAHAQGRVAPPRHCVDPPAVQNMMCHKQGEHSHTDPLMGCLTHKAIGHQKQHGHRHGRIHGDFYFESWFHVLILCCERAPSSNCLGHQRPHWLRRGSYKCPFR